MNIDRALRVRDSLKTRVNDLYSCARLSGMTGDAINSAMQTLRADCPKRTPQWVFSYIDGYRDALQSDLYANWLVFGGYIDGVFYSNQRKRDDYYEKHGIEPVDYADNGRVLNRGHYWSDRVQYRGGIFTRDWVKPYFVG